VATEGGSCEVLLGRMPRGDGRKENRKKRTSTCKHTGQRGGVKVLGERRKFVIDTRGRLGKKQTGSGKNKGKVNGLCRELRETKAKGVVGEGAERRGLGRLTLVCRKRGWRKRLQSGRSVIRKNGRWGGKGRVLSNRKKGKGRTGWGEGKKSRTVCQTEGQIGRLEGKSGKVDMAEGQVGDCQLGG